MAAEAGKARAGRLLTDVLALCKKIAPAAEARVTITSGRSANTRFARSEITSTGDVDETEVELQLAFGKRVARLTTNQVDPTSLRAAIERASRMAQIAPESPEHLPALGPQRFAEVPAAYDAATDRLGAAARAAAARATIEAAQAASGRAAGAGDGGRLDVAGYFEHGGEVTALGTSAGLRAFHAQTRAGFTTTARTEDGTGSGWAGAESVRAADLDAPALARAAIDRAARSRRPQRLQPGRYTVILEPAAVGELLAFLLSSLDARAADEGRSFLSRPGGGNRLGEDLFGERVTLRSDPADPLTPASPFSREGVPHGRVTWIDKGKVAALAYGRYWAQQKGRAPAPAPSCAHLLGGEADGAAGLLAGVKRGVLITRFWYTRMVDPQAVLVTGLTRDGVFLVENGAVVAPVNNFRFNESPVSMLRNADALTRRTERTPGLGALVRVPGLRTHEFNLASVSDAI